MGSGPTPPVGNGYLPPLGIPETNIKAAVEATIFQFIIPTHWRGSRGGFTVES